MTDKIATATKQSPKISFSRGEEMSQLRGMEKAAKEAGLLPDD